MEEIKVNGTLVLTLVSKQDWINKCPNYLPNIPHHEKLLFVDKNGDTLTIGADFIEAETKASYPVKVYHLQRVSHYNPVF